jgi:hypothetical protein
MILTMTTAMVVPAVFAKVEEERLFAVGREIESLLRQARVEAVVMGQPVPFKIRKSGVEFMLPVDPSLEPDLSNEPAPLSILLPKGIEIALPNMEDKTLEGRTDEFILVFTPSGFCEIPVIRLKQGGLWVEKSFNPLTAIVENETVSAE